MAVVAAYLLSFVSFWCAGEQIGEKEAFFTDDAVFSYCEEMKGGCCRISAFHR